MNNLRSTTNTCSAVQSQEAKKKTPTREMILEQYFKEKQVIERFFSGKVKERLLANLEEKSANDLKRV